jgi:hypothetical protein
MVTKRDRSMARAPGPPSRRGVGTRPGVTGKEHAEIKRLKRENARAAGGE